ncbi:Golgi transport complex subunit Cog6, putative [Talaromyces stipitatus ATCC 10500]|uniref:Conserved oligomeric Golgi complex subunit 6 n=1 Tax=Talaromyces stipitatus (strain ATCC 10500 / CBS 375.48 / QM 6759 / NRRL 1006) TaxID=441959 RepID=B8MCW6_TALSN|nr:Golgi transport complex subunit Cog6, putative [Talaromyces stipitatus ATCC 10500]EED17492.1 Golgi transport complex subunit Cog6, putative [Talaromyces stipitatus ATCC 10500]
MTSYFTAPDISGEASNAISPPGGANVAPRSTALSNRLASVLSASYADSDIRDALETLDKRGVKNTAEKRRQLRLDIQKEVLDCNGEIVADFGKVAEQLNRIGTVISNLQQTCAEMRKHITLAKQETAPVLDEASSLLDQKEDAETKQHLLDAFTTHFIVPEEDINALTLSEAPVNDNFFAVLSRVKRIHNDCQVLLGGENQRLGLEIMEQSSKQLNAAYQKLYKWIQNEFRSLDLEDPRISGSIRQALRVLAERPSLFHSCLDFFAEAREYILSDAFHYALTDAASGGAVGERNVKPIEFSAHDPLRYVGDMLAWVHSAAVSEKEALEALFVYEGEELARGFQAGISSEPWSRVDEGEVAVFDGQKALNDLVNRDLNGVSRSLRQRVELVIQGHDDAVTTYRVVNLLSFYRLTFSKLVGAESHLVEVIAGLVEFTFKHFEGLMRDQLHMHSADSHSSSPPDDFSAPQFLTDQLEVLTSLMKEYNSSVGAASDIEDSEENGFTPVLRVALDPFLDIAKTSAQEVDDHKTSTIYKTNILLAVRGTISPYKFAAATHLAPISTALSHLRIELLDIQRRYLLETSGLQQLLTALESSSPSTSSHKEAESSTTQLNQNRNLAEIAGLPAFQPATLSAISQQLDDFLPSALMDATDNLKLIRSSTLVKSVTEEAVEEFCRDFEFVEGMIIGADEARGTKWDMSRIVGEGESDIVSVSVRNQPMRDETEGEEKYSLRALFPRTVGEIRVLLS